MSETFGGRLYLATCHVDVSVNFTRQTRDIHGKTASPGVVAGQEGVNCRCPKILAAVFAGAGCKICPFFVRRADNRARLSPLYRNVCGFVNFTWWRFLIHSGGYGGSPYAAIARHSCIFSDLWSENAMLLPWHEKFCAEIS
ncbi:hypothetical protein [uncultured Cardiobacterium sp.]|uniref:hypothetical protein n=1 Tax=uncultured Cardiobacterium sp. TaxID=417619 RepID=UPI0026218D10|nr:hypothetical protein [uncultured Cardiobacterium sp.]